MAIKHAFTSTITDEGAQGKVGPTHWNADHVIDDGGYVPTGGIIIWSGAADAIPTGWHLCDGTSGTPNLRDRFIVGAGTSYAVGATGGSTTVTLTEAQMPTHTHTQNAHTHPHPYGQAYAGNINTGAQTGAAGTNAYRIDHLLTEIPATTATNNNAGSGTAHANLPPYYALCYIMKVAA